LDVDQKKVKKLLPPHPKPREKREKELILLVKSSLLIQKKKMMRVMRVMMMERLKMGFVFHFHQEMMRMERVMERVMERERLAKSFSTGTQDFVCRSSFLSSIDPKKKRKKMERKKMERKKRKMEMEMGNPLRERGKEKMMERFQEIQ